MSEISDTLLKQRLRNQIIESLEAFANKRKIEDVGTVEIIEQWYDIVDEDRLDFYDEPIFSAKELDEVKRFHNLVELSCPKVPSTCKLEDLTGCMEWSGLVAAACEAIAVFQKRGLSD